MKEAGKLTESGKKRPIPYSTQALPPHSLELNSRRYRTLAVKWAMGTFPPMSNTAMMEESGKLGEAAFSTLKERLAQDELTPQDEEETNAALDEILAIYINLCRKMNGKARRA